MKLVTFYNKPKKQMWSRKTVALAKNQDGVESLTVDVVNLTPYKQVAKFDFDGKPYTRKIKQVSMWVDGFTFMGKTWEADSWKVEFNL